MLEQIVDRLLGEVAARYPGNVPDVVALEGDVARRGYLWRIAETDVFVAARGATPDLATELRVGVEPTALARTLAAAEPLERPTPDDAKAVTWRVPGPGGHVRHYGALASIEAAGLAERSFKREWLFGFCFRCCEEAQADPLS